MKKDFPRKKLFKLSAVLLPCLVLLVMHSCKKNLTVSEADVKISDTEVLNAKSWYEEAYPINRVNKSGLQTNSVSAPDPSQIIKPDWQRPSHYKRFNNDVIEIPLDPSAKFNAVLKNTDYNKELNKPGQSRSSFLMLKNNGKYEAYIMTIIGDADYLKGDVSKLALNTYNKRDTNFSGLVFYFTPKGRYLSGYRYKNGRRVKPQQAQSPQVQNVKLRTNNNLHVDCYDVINTITTNGVITAQYVAFSFCTVFYSDEAPPPTSGGDSLGGGGSTPVPPQCPPGTVVNSIHLQVNGNAPPGEEPIDPNDPGFPPPTPSEQQCRIITTQDSIVTDQLTDTCLKAQVTADLGLNLATYSSQITNAIFADSKSFNLVFHQAALPAVTDGVTDGQGVPSQGHLDIDITLNSTTLPHSAKEYIAATVIHEAAHAYMIYFGKSDQFDGHQTMATQYVDVMKQDLQIMFPGMTDEDAEALAWGGLGKTPAWKNMVSTNPVKANRILSINKQYKDATGTKGHRC